MTQEDYCSYEVAKLLKEKGFDTPCMGRYSVRSKEFHLDCTKMCNNGGLFECAAPTHQMAMKWLREVHNKHCDIGYDIDLYWFFQIIELKELIEHFDYSETKYYHAENETGFNAYEDAVEAALKYALEKLI